MRAVASGVATLPFVLLWETRGSWRALESAGRHGRKLNRVPARSGILEVLLIYLFVILLHGCVPDFPRYRIN
jgi:hypothetical protein